ncbi:MAG: lipid II flippase MurJ [bacterium]
MSNSKKSLIKATLILTVLTLIGKSIGFIREIVLAYYFGLSDEYDIFLVAITIAVILNSTIYYFAQNYFIPLYNKFEQNKSANAKGNDFFNFSFYLFFLCGILIFVFLLIFKQPILNILIANKSKELFKLAENIYVIYLFTVPLTAALSIIAAFYQAKFNFVIYAVSQLVWNAIIVTSIVLFNSSFGILVIPYATVFATFVQFVLMIVPITKKFNFNKKIFQIIKTETNIISSAFVFTVIIELISLSYSFIDRYYFEKLSTGAISALNYANNLINLPVNIFTMALATVLFSKFSFNSGNNLGNENEKIYYKSLKYNFMLTIPIAILFFYNGVTIINILFQRGQFSYKDTLLTSEVLKYYAIGIPFIAGYSIMNKLLYSLSMVKYLLLIVLVSFFIKVFSSYLLIDQYYHNSLAISSTLAFIFMFLSGYVGIQYFLKFSQKSFFINNLLYYFVQSIIAFFITSFLMFEFKFFQYFNQLIFICVFIIIVGLFNIILDSEINNYLKSLINTIKLKYNYDNN